MGSTLGFQTKRELLLQMVSRYREASVSQKGALLDEIAATTGYARRYAMWLLNHPQQMLQPPRRRRQRTFGPEVQHALFLAWQAANQICTKRLMPFLPTLIEALERQGHLHLTDACRTQLLSMSAATADRLLRPQRGRGVHGISTTRAGTLLKQQIPIRTFEQWNETRPGFLEADLVAHCGSQAQGSFLYTLTLTDIATGWTECFPLLSKSAEAVLLASQQARAFFPFPILGLDTDNGCEFINEDLRAYCEAEQITFTRGREGLKNDQCHVEQKNGAIVRQVVGYARLEGARAYQQLCEVYQALRLYINGFQPSMKLQAKQYDGRTVRRVYDAAKTPLQRLLLSQVLPASQEQELLRTAQVLDPLRLFHHLQVLQQALFDLRTSVPPDAEGTSPGAVLPFCVGRCIAELGTAAPETVEESWQEQVKRVPDPILPEEPEQEADYKVPSARPLACSSPAAPSQQPMEEKSFPAQSAVEEEATRLPATTSSRTTQSSSVPSDGLSQASHAPESRQRLSAMTIEQAIHDYLEDQSNKHRRSKTLEWHQQALGLFQHYLLTEHQCCLLGQITEAQVRGWLARLPQVPTATGALRSPSTLESYARSARAFCQWLVRHRYLPTTPFAHLLLPQVEHRLLRPLEPEEWEHLLLACQPPKETGELTDRATARNRAILWVLFDTGMRVSEVCRLRLGDVDPEQGILRIREKGSKERRFTLGHEGLGHLLAYLDQYRLGATVCFEERGTHEDHLFLSEAGRPLTKSAIALLFGRLRKRARITGKHVSPSLLRETFAVRYLQAGGDPHMLQELLGLTDQATITRSQYQSAQMLAEPQRKEHLGDSLPRHISGQPDEQEGEDSAERPFGSETLPSQPPPDRTPGALLPRRDTVNDQLGRVETASAEQRSREDNGRHTGLMRSADP